MTLDETLDKIRAANPKLKLRSINFWDDGQIGASVTVSNEWCCENTVDELCAKLAAIKVKTPEEIKAEEIATLKAKLAALETAGK